MLSLSDASSNLESWAPYKPSEGDLVSEMKLHETRVPRARVLGIEEGWLERIFPILDKMNGKMERENHPALRDSICWRKIFGDYARDMQMTFRVIWKTTGDVTIESYWDMQSRLRLLGNAYYKNRFGRYVSGDRQRIDGKEAQDEYLMMWGMVQTAMAESLEILDDITPGFAIARGFKLSVVEPSVLVLSQARTRSEFLLPTWRRITGKPDSMDAKKRFLEDGWTHWSSDIDSNDEDFPSPENAFKGVRIPASVVRTCGAEWEATILQLQGVPDSREIVTQFTEYLAALRAAPSIPDEDMFKVSTILNLEGSNAGTS